eukprot:TRINITY_DN70859_c0_g1_i1.p2 TRINITY_DN70859_c0_g1~~TRINITY_DN70859_c0_g1_i1.p2  ORF type:complete len:140 (+),score=35.17 TRINITY_DN70859_c0_g1_i1:75-494(+)
MHFFGEDGEFYQYIRGMSADKTWGDEFVLRALADLYNAEVHLLTSAQSGFYILYAPMAAEPQAAATTPRAGAASKPRIFLAYTFPVHYDGLMADPPERLSEGGAAQEAASKLSGSCVSARQLVSPSQVDLDLCFLEAAA